AKWLFLKHFYLKNVRHLPLTPRAPMLYKESGGQGGNQPSGGSQNLYVSRGVFACLKATNGGVARLFIKSIRAVFPTATVTASVT
ncbi:MAG TPA: hypothetical protein VHP34_04985, partial [Alphaproteobacteria bacterium]|nr:hypothetical protein [Alphaproteobacteria bacterium]